MMRALTLKQPWASAIVRLGKDVENRRWAPAGRHLGTRIAVHAGSSMDRASALPRDGLPSGAIVGSVELVGYVDSRTRASVNLTPEDVDVVLSSAWAEDSPFWWYVRAPLELIEPVPIKGSLGLWTIPQSIENSLLDRSLYR